MMETAERVCAVVACCLLAGNALVVGFAALAEFAPATLAARVRPILDLLRPAVWSSGVAKRLAGRSGQDH